jgi:hypothetical protein
MKRTTACLALFPLLAGCLPGIDLVGGGPGVSLEQGCVDYDHGGDGVATVAVARLSCYRALMGLDSVEEDPRLSAAAQGHADYLAATGEYGHGQGASSHPLFTGASPMDRLTAAGFSFDPSLVGVHEVVAFQDQGADPSRAVDLWMDTVYHREPLSTPEVSAVGFGAAGIYSVMELIAPWESTTGAHFARYPAEGQGDARGSFDSDTETPDPMPAHGLVGVPITLTALAPGWLGNDDPYGLRVDRARSSLRSLGGEERALVFLEPANQPALLRTIVAVPASPLPPRSTWDVTLVFTLAGIEYEESWSFATAAASE